MHEHVDILKRLVQRRADVTAADSRGNTSLHHAAYWNKTAAIHMHVRSGANVDPQDSNRQTPFHRASSRQAVGAAHALLRRGASVNAPDNRGQLPLHIVARISRKTGPPRSLNVCCGRRPTRGPSTATAAPRRTW